jgi:hypothetical protein
VLILTKRPTGVEYEKIWVWGKNVTSDDFSFFCQVMKIDEVHHSAMRDFGAKP